MMSLVTKNHETVASLCKFIHYLPPHCPLQEMNCFSSGLLISGAQIVRIDEGPFFPFPSFTGTILLFPTTTRFLSFSAPPPHYYRSSSSFPFTCTIWMDPTSTLHRPRTDPDVNEEEQGDQ